MSTAANARFCAFSKKAFKTRIRRGIVHENQTVDQPGGWPMNRIGASIIFILTAYRGRLVAVLKFA